MKADISIVIALVIVFVLTMTILFFVSTHNAILESTFYGYRNPMWLRLDRDLRQLAYNALKEASYTENKTVAYKIIRNWSRIFNSEINNMVASINNITITLSNETKTLGSSYALLAINISVYDLGLDSVTYYITVNASITNFTLLNSTPNEYNYSLIATIRIKQYIYYDEVEVIRIYPEGVHLINITYVGSGENIITTDGEVSEMILDVGGVKISAQPIQ